MKHRFFYYFISILLLICIHSPAVSQVFGQPSISFLVKNENGQPISNIQVSFNDDSRKMCIQGLTNHEGKVTLNTNHTPKYVYFHDTRQNPVYGIKVFHIKHSSNLYEIRMPSFPNNAQQAAGQMDRLMDVISKAEGAHSFYDFFKSANFNKALPGIGVPGVFSISPIPTTDSRGRSVLRVEGALVRHFNRLTRGILPGSQVSYEVH